MTEHPLMTTAEVCEFGRFSKRTLARKRKADSAWLPAAPVQGGRWAVFRLVDVYRALALPGPEPVSAPAEPKRMPDDEFTEKFREARSRQVRHPETQGGRVV